MRKIRITVAAIPVFLLCFVPCIFAQTFTREFKIERGGIINVKNHFGRVEVTVRPPAEETSAEKNEPYDGSVSFQASSSGVILEKDLKINTEEQILIEAVPSDKTARIDMSIVVPERARLRIETLDGEVRVSGNLESIDIKTETGTIAADVPTDDLKYNLFWTASRPRFLSDFELEKVKERSAGRFLIKGSFPADEDVSGPRAASTGSHVEKETANKDKSEPEAAATGFRVEKETADRKPKTVALNFTTARGIVIINVPPNEVSSDLRERPLTNAAKAIVRSGDSLLMEAIRRASPKYFGDYTKTLPPFRREPAFSERAEGNGTPGATVKQVRVRVTDQFNRTIPALQPADFEVLENNESQQILSVQPSTAPVNLVLLLDVSGSVDNYVNFIRKAARNFVETVSRNDRISIVIFNEDVKVLSGFSGNKAQLSERLDSFDAGGGTAYYDSIAYTLTETLRPLKGERTAIVILTDGDDNRSFLPFDSLLGSIEESGALVYPLYVPSALVAASEGDPNAFVDPLRSRYLNVSVTSKAGGEGERLAKVSGGIYYPITQLSQIQRAYDDIVLQLRTAYSITFRSNTAGITGNRASPRVKVKVAKPNTFVSLGPVVKAAEK